MKLALFTLLCPIFVFATSFVEDEAVQEDEIVLVAREPEFWDIIPKTTNEQMEPEAIPKPEPQSLLSWAINSFLGTYFTTPISPITKSDSAPEINALQETLSEADARYIASILNCDMARLAKFDISKLQRVVTFKGLRKFAILAQLAELGERDLFEMFFDCNLATILAEITSSREFHNVVFSCIKIKSMYCFFNVIHNRNLRFGLNAPQAVVVASMVGCEEILKFIIDNIDCTDFVWEWKGIDGGDGYMRRFGPEPFPAALFLGAIKAISGGHFECLNILIESGLDISYNEFLLLKEISAYCSTEIFELIYSRIDRRVPLQDMKVIFLIAISRGNTHLVEYLLLSGIKFNIQVKEHLVAALNSKNERIVEMILPNVKHENIDKEILSLAASLGVENNFISVLKVSKQELVLSSLCNCIVEPAYRLYVPLIISEIALTADMISLSLSFAVRYEIVEFVHHLLGHKNCIKSSVKVGFKEALFSDNVVILSEFFSFKKFDLMHLIRKNDINPFLKKMVEISAWNTLKLFTEKYYHTPDFPKHLLVAMIIETDQVEIVRFLVENGAPFAHTYLQHIKNPEIFSLVSNQISK